MESRFEHHVSMLTPLAQVRRVAAAAAAAAGLVCCRFPSHRNYVIRDLKKTKTVNTGDDAGHVAGPNAPWAFLRAANVHDLMCVFSSVGLGVRLAANTTEQSVRWMQHGTKHNRQQSAALEHVCHVWLRKPVQIQVDNITR